MIIIGLIWVVIIIAVLVVLIINKVINLPKIKIPKIKLPNIDSVFVFMPVVILTITGIISMMHNHTGGSFICLFAIIVYLTVFYIAFKQPRQRTRLRQRLIVKQQLNSLSKNQDSIKNFIDAFHKYQMISKIKRLENSVAKLEEYVDNGDDDDDGDDGGGDGGDGFSFDIG